MANLPTTGTAALLELLSPLIPDQLINERCPQKRGRGRRFRFSAAQLFRVHLLALLTPAHSFNLLLKLLQENRSWRSFAHLRNQYHIPDANMLCDFRARVPLDVLRSTNLELLKPLLERLGQFSKTVAVIDATDLPAATNTFKKNLEIIQLNTPREVVAV